MNEMMQTHPDVQNSSIKGFIDNGLLPHMDPQNVNHVDLLTVNGGDGYVHLLKNVVPENENLRGHRRGDADYAGGKPAALFSTFQGG